MNNKYLSGLLAGVLTAGAMQGSGNEGKMPGLGKKQTPVVRAQTADELPADLQELFLAFSQSLAERGYRAQINLSAIQMPTQITSINTSALNRNNGVQSNINAFELPGMVLPEHERPSAPAELTHLTIGENGEIKKKTKLDPYSMQVATKYFETADDLYNAMRVNSKFKELDNRNRINHVPVTEANKALFDHIETQQIFGPNDYILPGMYRYIFKYPVAKKGIEKWVNELKNKYDENKHNNEAAKKSPQKPIVFEYQLLPVYWNVDPILEKKDDIFEIKAYWVKGPGTSLDHYGFGEFYHKLIPYMGNKRIVFDRVRQSNRESIKRSFDLTKVEIHSWFQGDTITYDRYLIEKEEYKSDNLYFGCVKISGETKPEEQRHQLKVLSMDKKVEHIDGVYNTGYLNLEFLGNVKCDLNDIAINSKDLQKQRSVTFASVQMQLGNQKIYRFKAFQYNNDDVSEKVREYIQYVKDNNLEYLSGFVNFDNKPSYLTDAEWRKVMVLTRMVKELMDLVDQNFDEYEANPNAVPANGNSYDCDGYGCAGYNPYRQYFYGCGYGC